MSARSESGPSLTVCLSFDWDTMSVWPTAPGFGAPDRLSLSRGEFGAVAAPRIFELFARYGIKGTFFTPGFTALAYPDLVRRALDEGHEIGHHGWMHENPGSLDAAGERAVIERGLEALDRVAGVRPKGYRLPGSQFGPNVVEVLLEYGFLYEGTHMASDFYACYLRDRDHWSGSEPYVFGKPTELVGMPAAWHLSDFPLFEFVRGWSTVMASPSAVRETWQADFDWAYANCPGGVFVLPLHPQVIGRGGRLAMLEELIRYMRDLDGVRFERMGDYAERWKAANPLERWQAENPILAGSSALS